MSDAHDHLAKMLLPVGRRNAVGGPGRRAARVIHQDVDGPECLFKLFQSIGEAVGVCKIPLLSETGAADRVEDRKSTRLNSSHVKISYAVFCLKKKKK